MRLAIVGAGGFGTEVYALALDINNVQRRWDDYIFVDMDTSKQSLDGKRILTYEQLLETEDLKNTEFIVTIGENGIRSRIYSQIQEKGLQMATLVHPQTFIAGDVSIGKGVVVSYGAYISSGTIVKNNVIIQPYCQLGHGVEIGENSFLAGGSIIGGGCNIGENVHIGLSCSVREVTSIGNNAIIAMGSIVMQDVPEQMLVMGNPARIISESKGKRVFTRGKKFEE